MEALLQTFLQQFQHLNIQLKELTSATNNFNDETNYLGVGGFGKVYKGEVSHYKGRSMVAIKRLDKSGSDGQGIAEFLKEIMTLYRYSHENLISLFGFCYQGEEMILVYELASRGSLDHHLSSPDLTWTRRLKLCLDAAKCLSYLHDPRETHQRLIHCDIKSGNILLDDQWNAKVSDLGLSTMGSANEQQSLVVTLAAGTRGYVDPQYLMTNTLTKESDVYSFGVVLFEVLCGRLCYARKDGRTTILVPGWIESYKQKKLNDIIFKSKTTQSMDQGSLKIFSGIAYRCLNASRDDRPTMTEVVTELETALKSQEFSERNLLFDYEEMTKSAEPPLNYRSKFELWNLLFKGVLLNEGKTWFSLNKKGEHREMISFAECLVSGPSDEFLSAYDSRFVVGPYRYRSGNVFKARVKPQFLSLGIMYTVNLMFRNPGRNSRFQMAETKSHELISLRYKLEGETKTSISYLAYESDDGYCWMCELYQFISDQRTVDLEILFEGFSGASTEIKVEGIDFRPLEEVEQTDKKKPASDSDAVLEEKLPTDFENILQQSKNIVQWTTKKEAYSILRKGFLINDGKEWFSLDNNGKKCLMLPARAIFESDNRWGVILSLLESRFGEAFQCRSRIPDIICGIKFQLLSCDTTYACYLVYKLPKEQPGFEVPIQVEGGRSSSSDSYIYLVSPQTPVVRPNAGQNTHSPLNRPKIKGLPRQRDDGWMEVQIMEFQTSTTDSLIPVVLEFFESNALKGLLVQGLETRPV